MTPLLLAMTDPSLKAVIVITAVAVSPALLAIYHAGRKREMEHKERLKALEMGLPVPGAAPWPALTAILIGAGVPVAALAAALVATAIGPRAPQDADHMTLAAWSSQNHSTAYYGTVWGGAAGVGVTAVLAGAVLAWRAMGLRARTDRGGYVEAPYAAKPPLDPDAYDTVSRRG